MSAALAGVDPVGSAAAARENDWRRHYVGHLRRLVEAGLDAGDPVGAVGPAAAIAQQGLAAVHEGMAFARSPQTPDEPVQTLLSAAPNRFESVRIEGGGVREREFTLPYRGGRLRGPELLARLDAWVAAGIVEPGVREAVARVVDNPQWLRLDGRTVVVLGAGAEMGPLRALLRWGADMVGVDLPRPGLWRGAIEAAQAGAGSLTVPVPAGYGVGEGRVAEAAGADLLHDAGSVAAWLSAIPGPLVLGNYVYADGATFVRLAAACDVLTESLLERGDVELAFLATPTDAFAVPGDAVAASVASYRASAVKTVRGPLRVASGGRLFVPQYRLGTDPGISDSIIPQQGPNYLLAKRIHRWRGLVAADAGVRVSLNVAPPTRTRSVTKNRALAAAYAGAPRFGIEVFEPATSNTLMAALLVDDLCSGRPVDPVPWQREASAAAHGGLWRAGYDPRSVLGVAALLGLGAARG